MLRAGVEPALAAFSTRFLCQLGYRSVERSDRICTRVSRMELERPLLNDDRTPMEVPLGIEPGSTVYPCRGRFNLLPPGYETAARALERQNRDVFQNGARLENTVFDDIS